MNEFYEKFKPKETVQEALNGHERILKCLHNKDLKSLEAAMTAHLNDSKENIRKEAPA